MIILGKDPNRGHIGIGLEDPTELLDVNENVRIRNIGSNASAGALHYDSNGVLTTTVSDERMKDNINEMMSFWIETKNVKIYHMRQPSYG